MNARHSTLVLALLTGACAGKQLPPQKLADTEAAMQSASEIGGEQLPESSLHLRYARDQLATAKRLLDDGDEKRAHRMLDRARADAELALALARTERDRSAAKQAWSDVDELRNKDVESSTPAPQDTTATAPTSSPAPRNDLTKENVR